MKKTKILVPLDTTERSMHSLNWLKNFFSKNDSEITLMNVKEVILTNDMVIEDKFEVLAKESQLTLNKAENELEGYEVKKITTLGYAADQILKEVKEGNYDIIIMTKSTKKGIPRMLGSVTRKVVRNAQVAVIVLPE